MNIINVVNIKCGGCENKITSTLTKAGLSNITINVERQLVSFDEDVNTAKRELSRLGYPEVGSEDAKSLLKKGHSYLSCAVGRFL